MDLLHQTVWDKLHHLNHRLYKLWQIYLASMLPWENSASLFASSPTERPCYYLFKSSSIPPSPFLHASTHPDLHPSTHPPIHPPTQPASQPASRAVNTLQGLRVVLWTTCAVFTWLSRERVRKTGTLKPNRCMIQRRELWRVNFLYKSVLLLEQTAAWSRPRKHLHALWLVPLRSHNVFLLFHGTERNFAFLV